MLVFDGVQTGGLLSCQRAYVVYPPEGPRPPSSEEFYEIARKNKEREARGIER